MGKQRLRESRKCGDPEILTQSPQYSVTRHWSIVAEVSRQRGCLERRLAVAES
jgi:hypothetical protein